MGSLGTGGSMGGLKTKVIDCNDDRKIRGAGSPPFTAHSPRFLCYPDITPINKRVK
ncbi:MAG: hypothetical protein WBM32_21335 [Crocosphaera sp.]|jgi:hypothetical protein